MWFDLRKLNFSKYDGLVSASSDDFDLLKKISALS